jgi:hypothetical protein
MMHRKITTLAKYQDFELIYVSAIGGPLSPFRNPTRHFGPFELNENEERVFRVIEKQ